ncbi:sigma-54-dependent Fis family transcriptional regulator [Prauserella muralis]|nr:helix-turn-helix domain-containing protein [Prauserella muralis]TWE28521.1 transcriptional regulator of acetoin/glycerol metabolism [Prauserella muralis]
MPAASSGPPVPHTTAEWERVRQAKLDVLTRDPFAVDPADYPGVRPEVVASWRRSMLAGVDPGARHYAPDDDFQPRTRLAAVAQPIMNRLKDEISDLNCWGFLADRACRLLTVVVGDFPLAGRVHRQNLRPGMCFAEEVMGTNGMGCAHETQQAFIIAGTEHFRTDSEILTTTGVIIRDPFTKRYAGTLGAHCLREYGTTALLPLVVELGRSIEAQLLASREDGEREFFDAFAAAQRRHRAPVVGVSRRLCVVSTRARTVVHEADEELLRRLAEESGSRSRTVQRQLSSGVTVTIQVHPVPQPRGEFAAVLVLLPSGTSMVDDTGGDAGPGWVWEGAPADFRTQLARALRNGRAVLLTGERGCGKRHEARQALRGLAGSGGIAEFDCALAHLRPREWLRSLASAVSGDSPAVLLGHVTDLPAELTTAVADLLARAPVPVAGTTTDDAGHDGAVARVRESFPVLLTVPPLRERRNEFGQLCASLLAELGGGDEDGEQAVTLAPRAVAALLASDWPGNVRQLLQVLASARVRVSGPVIDVGDLPARHGRNQPAHPLDEVRAAERRVLMAALRETGGDRNAVAERLGISRATVYRKLKRYELD